MHIDVTGRTALLIGSDGAIGDALARMLNDDGAGVVRATSLEASPRDVDYVTIFAPPLSAGAVAAACSAFGSAFAARGGRILVIGSARGLVATRGRSEESIEAAGVLAAARVAAMDLAGRGVAVNALAVGAIDGTDADVVSHTAVRRSGTPEEAAAVALFLLDPTNTYMTGQVLAVDGGWSAGFLRDF